MALHLDGSYCVSVAKESNTEDPRGALEDNRGEEGGDSCNPQQLNGLAKSGGPSATSQAV